MRQSYAAPTVHLVDLKVEQNMIACKPFGQGVLAEDGGCPLMSGGAEPVKEACAPELQVGLG